MKNKLMPLAVVSLVALISAGCSSAPAQTTSGATGTTADRSAALKFADCMRDNGVKQFPDPDASGTYTIDGIANNSSVDTSSPAWTKALKACKDLQPAGFTGYRRSAEKQEIALKFAQCFRENGVPDFPDPDPDGPLIDTTRIPSVGDESPLDIPAFQAASDKCGALAEEILGLKGK